MPPSRLYNHVLKKALYIDKMASKTEIFYVNQHFLSNSRIIWPIYAFLQTGNTLKIRKISVFMKVLE